MIVNLYEFLLDGGWKMETDLLRNVFGCKGSVEVLNIYNCQLVAWSYGDSPLHLNTPAQKMYKYILSLYMVE